MPAGRRATSKRGVCCCFLPLHTTPTPGRQQQDHPPWGMSHNVSPQHEADFWSHGFLVVPSVFSKDEVASMRNSVHRYVQGSASLMRPVGKWRLPEHAAYTVDFGRDSGLRTMLDTYASSKRLHQRLSRVFGGTNSYRPFARTELSINRHLPYHRDVIHDSKTSPMWRFFDGHGPWDRSRLDGEEQSVLVAVTYLQDHANDNKSLTVLPGTNKQSFLWAKKKQGFLWATPVSDPQPRVLHPREGDVILLDFRTLHRGSAPACQLNGPCTPLPGCKTSGEPKCPSEEERGRKVRGPRRGVGKGIGPNDRIQIGVAFGRSNHFTAMWDRAMTLRNEIVLNTSMCVKGLSDDACVATWVENSLARDPMAAASGGSARGRRAIDASTVDTSRVEPVTDDARRGIVFIVGASRGIGLGLAQRFHAEGWKVHATVRDIAQPGAVGMLSKDRLTLYPLDVSNQAQIVALQERVTRDALAIDVLIHNAGVQTTNLTLAMAINAHAPFEVTRALMPAVLRSRRKAICLITSEAGSKARERRSKGRLSPYAASKLALNMRFRTEEPAWRAQGLTAVLMHPGWVKTEMGGGNAKISVEASTRGIATTLQKLQREQCGACLVFDGSRCNPWK